MVLSVFLVLAGGNAHGAQLTLSWATDAGAAGYKIYYGTASHTYGTPIDVGNVTTTPLVVADGYTYYMAATAYDSSNTESAYSQEISYTAQTCSYSLSPTSASPAASGGSGSISVTTQSGCSWTASSGASWITFTSGTSGTGSGTVAYTVASNTGALRTATSTIAGRTLTFTQSAAATTYTITASATTGGTITPSGSTTVTSGGSQSYTITANTGYTLTGVTVDGVSKGAITSYTFSSVTANHTIAATFTAAATTYTITASATAGGTITPSGSTTVTSGGSQSFTVTPSSGYAISSVTVDGVSKGAVSSYTFTSVAANHTIAASFAGVSQTLTRISVAPSSASVTVNGTKQFTATAYDQSGTAMAPQPTFSWTVSGGGTITSGGLFTAASAAGGPYTVKATSGSVSGTASVTVTSASAIKIGETTVLSGDDNGNGNLLLAQQTSLGQTATITSMSFYVTTTGGSLRLGIYDATGPSGGPGTLKAQTASFTPVSGWNTANVTSPVSLPAGTYWIAYLPSSNALGFKVATTGSAKFYSCTAGTMPTTFSTSPNSATAHWSFYATLQP